MNKYCTKAPTGWRCTRLANHVGPCAARLVTIEDGIVDFVLAKLEQFEIRHKEQD